MNIPLGRSRKTAVLTDTVLHYRLAGKERKALNSWLSHHQLKHFENGVTLVELIAKLNERRQFVIPALRFSKDTTEFCLPGPDSYVSAWVSTALGVNPEPYTCWDSLRDEVLAGANPSREGNIVERCQAILSPANDFVRAMSAQSLNVGEDILKAFPSLRQVFPNGMTKNDVLKAFDAVSGAREFQTAIGEQLMLWLNVPATQLESLRKHKPLIDIDQVKVLTIFFIELWAEYLNGKNADPNDREDYLLMTYAPAVKNILTGDKRFATRAAKACAGTIFQELVIYVGAQFDLN